MQHPFLIGVRVYLRRLEESDLCGDYFDWLNDYEVTKYLVSGTLPNSEQAMEQFVSSANSKAIMFAIMTSPVEKHIGNIKIDDIDWVCRYAEIGIMIGDKESWSRGYGREAVELCIDYCFKRLNLNKVRMGTTDGNKGMVKIVEALGFVLEGRLRETVFVDGVYRDRLCYGLLRREWKS